MRVDERIVSVEKLERAGTVLVDAHSLYQLADELIERQVPAFGASILTEQGGPRLANVIQNIVLYDRVIVDSLLFQIDSKVSIACELFPDVIRGVYLRDDVRLRIGSVVDSIAGVDSVSEPPVGISSEEWMRWQWKDGSEKQLMDRMDEVVPDLIPPEYQNDEEILRLYNRNTLHTAFIPLCCRNSMMTLGRAHFYLELARELGVPLSTDPIRSRYFKVLSEKFRHNLRQGTPEKVVAFFEDNVLKKAIDESEGLVSVDLSIPAVAEMVLNYAKRKRCSLHTATLEIRESRNARRFREWCARFASLESQGRVGGKEQIEMLDELKAACEVWRNDAKEEVEYRTRKLNLEKIPVLGIVLKALNMHEGKSFRDLILTPGRKYSYFLFLNDLIRRPTE